MTIGGGARLTPLGARGHVLPGQPAATGAAGPSCSFELPEVRYPERLNCAAELLDAVIARHGGDRRCLLTPQGDVWSYADVLRTVNQIGRGARPVSWASCPGNRVLLRGPNNPWLAACWLAVLKAGGGGGDHDAAAAGG